jgi:hypothetical protein
VPLDWAQSKNNLGNALRLLGQRECGTTRLLEAVDAYHDALTVYTQERAPLDWAMTFGNQGVTLMVLAERTMNSTMAERGILQIEAAFETTRAGGHALNAAYYEGCLPHARTIRDRFKVS